MGQFWNFRRSAFTDHSLQFCINLKPMKLKIGKIFTLILFATIWVLLCSSKIHLTLLPARSRLVLRPPRVTVAPLPVEVTFPVSMA